MATKKRRLALILLVLLVGCGGVVDPLPGVSDNPGTSGNQSGGNSQTAPDTNPGNTTDPNEPPELTNVQVTGKLTEGRLSTVTVLCTATDADGMVISFSADLSDIGGSNTQLLAKGNNNEWSWTGMVTPPRGGTQTIVFTARDDKDATVVLETSVEINVPPTIATPSIAGNLTENQEGQVTVSCIATDADGPLKSVVVNLSPIGGRDSQLLATSDTDEWSWVGTITPPSGGTKTVAFTAVDDKGATDTIEISYDINFPPTITNFSLIGNVTVNQKTQVTVSCTVTDTDGTVDIVVADLLAIGGLPAQPLTRAGEDTWEWTGDVIPVRDGNNTIRVVAMDDKEGVVIGEASVRINRPPILPFAGTAAVLVQGIEREATIRCLAADDDGTVESVTADLSAVGGASAQALTKDAGEEWSWSWTGPVAPGSSGSKTILVTATDNDGGTVFAYTFLSVSRGVTNAPVIESWIDGAFNGWHGDTIFFLGNGQIWQQTSYDYLYHYAYRPWVMIVSDLVGYTMWVEDVSSSITVKQLDVIEESYIDGSFEGWDGDTVFVLDNGQVWQQTDYSYLYHYDYHPRVTIFRGLIGEQMMVEDVDETIKVERIR